MTSLGAQCFNCPNCSHAIKLECSVHLLPEPKKIKAVSLTVNEPVLDAGSADDDDAKIENEDSVHEEKNVETKTVNDAKVKRKSVKSDLNKEKREIDKATLKAEREAAKATLKAEREAAKAAVKTERESKKGNKNSIVVAENVKPALPTMVTISVTGPWQTVGDSHFPSDAEDCKSNSMILNNRCLFYVWKLALRHLCFSRGVITMKDLDNANLVPHIKVRNHERQKRQQVHDARYEVNVDHLSAKADFLTIDFDERNDLHCTMIYSKGIGKRANTPQLFHDMLVLLNDRPELIELYSSLPDFGREAAHYWVETSAQYPNNIVPPADYVPSDLPLGLPKDKKYLISPAGTILSVS